MIWRTTATSLATWDPPSSQSTLRETLGQAILSAIGSLLTVLLSLLFTFSNPSISQTTQASPRNVFSKNRRFMSLTHRYISKEHNMANLCTASPGPKYCE